MDWSLLGCGARGQVTFAPDEPGLRDRLTTSLSTSLRIHTRMKGKSRRR